MSTSFPETGKLKVALVTGEHPYDVPGLHAAFKSISEIDFYPQHMSEFATCPDEIRDAYDVVVFYNFHQETPGKRQDDFWDQSHRYTVDHFGSTKQGLFLLHHSILAYPKYDEIPSWSEIVGIQDRRFDYHLNQDVKIEIANADHPITKGVEGWQMVDETYTMAEPDDSCEVLMTTEHSPSMHALAWTRQYKSSRVFCFQCGHDNVAFSHPSFRQVLQRGIEWCAEKI